MVSPPLTESSFKCNHCDLAFKNDKGLKTHIRKTHKSFDLKTPEKEQSISVIEEPILNLTPVKSCRREDEAVNEEITTDIQESEIKHFKCIFCPEDDGYCHCGKCEDCESMITKLGMNIHIINEHEPKMIYNHFGRDWVMEHRNWISGTYSPVWNKTWKDLNVL